MNTDVLDLALYAAWRARAISCIEMRILDTVNHAAQGTVVTLSNAELAARIGVAVRTLTRHVERLVDRGYLLVQQRAGKPSDWGVEQDPARWGRQAGPRSNGSTPVIRDHSQTDPPRSSATMDPGDYGHFDPPPNSASQRPEVAASRAGVPASSTSSSSLDLNSLETDDDGRVAREQKKVVAGLVGLGLDADQAATAVRVNPRLTIDDVAAWDGWLKVCTAYNPIGVMVRRLERGDPVPIIYARRPSVPPGAYGPPYRGERRGPPMAEAPTETLAEIKVRCAARKAELALGLPAGL